MYPTPAVCPRCGSEQIFKNGSKGGRPRYVCCGCNRSFGPTYGTPLYRLKTPAKEVANALVIVMRRGSLCAAEEITGHKYETIGEWLRRAGEHAEALTEALGADLHLTEVEVDAFWSFVKKSAPLLGTAQTRRRRWAQSPTHPETPRTPETARGRGALRTASAKGLAGAG
jgi:transposase-like protein